MKKVLNDKDKEISNLKHQYDDLKKRYLKINKLKKINKHNYESIRSSNILMKILICKNIMSK